jgi:hypothetical protein
MPDLVLEYHRLKTPIDHPDLSVTRAKLEVPVSGVSFTYLACVNKVCGCSWSVSSYALLADWAFTDKSVFAFVQVNAVTAIVGRMTNWGNFYRHAYDPTRTTSDHYIDKYVGGTGTILASEAIDIDNSGRGGRISISGSVIKGMRYEIPTPVHPLSLPSPNATISATDTTYASGYYGARTLRHTYPHSGTNPASIWLLDPASELPQAQLILEADIEGNGKDAPYAPSLSKNLVEVTSLSGLPDFLYQETRKYQVLRSKGFRDEEMELLLGYVPQHQVDLDSVTWGAFEFHPDKASTVIITIIGDNPYRAGATERQRAKAKRAFKAPKSYGEAVALYNQLKRDYPHWLAGKDSFAYQVLGLEVLDWLQNADFYYGELLEHKTHYSQLKRVPEWEIESRILELKARLEGMKTLPEERDKHLKKLDELLKKGW